MRHDVLVVVFLCCCHVAGAQVTNTTASIADAFLCTGSPSNPELSGADLSGLNFGAAGTLVVSPASSAKGEFQSIVKFNLTNDVALFNSAYGSNHWLISGLSLQLTSNDGASGEQPNNQMFPGISGGAFVVEWLSDNDWVEGTGNPNMPTSDGVCYDSLSTLLSAPYSVLCTNIYSPPGNNVPVIYTLPLNTNLLNCASNGALVTLLFKAADNQIGYLFNSYNFGRNQPSLNVVAAPLLKIVSGTLTNGTFLLSAVGGKNATYQIQASTNLAATHWQTIGTAASDGNGVIRFYDYSASNQPQRYYRLSH